MKKRPVEINTLYARPWLRIAIFTIAAFAILFAVQQIGRAHV